MGMLLLALSQKKDVPVSPCQALAGLAPESFDDLADEI